MNEPITFLKKLLGLGIGHERTKRAQKNIATSVVLKGFSIILGLVSMPLTIHYLEPQKYGIWVTLSSLIAWVGFFDIGLGGGLRNRFAEALAQGKHELARTYVSTTYAILSIIIGIFLVLFLLINPFLSWNAILNVGQIIAPAKELKLLAFIAFTTFSMSFVLRLISTILTADQRPALASIFDLISQSFVVIIIIILVRTTRGSLMYLALAQSIMPVLVLMISSICFFNGKYSNYRPSYSYVKFGLAKDLFSLGIKFFVLGIASILLYQTNNIIISNLFGPEQVTPYNVAFKYFTVLTMGFGIIISPFWSAFTEAWVKKEITWIKNIMRKLFSFWVFLVIIGIIMVISSKWIFAIWIGDKVQVTYSMSILVCGWALINALNSVYSHFFNGIGRVKVQMILGISAAVFNVPLAIYFGKRIGIEGILLANIIVLLPGIFIYPYQYKKLITDKALGIWNK